VLWGQWLWVVAEPDPAVVGLQLWGYLSVALGPGTSRTRAGGIVHAVIEPPAASLPRGYHQGEPLPC